MMKLRVLALLFVFPCIFAASGALPSPQILDPIPIRCEAIDFDKWITSFASLPVSDRKPYDDFDGDGASNLVEFYLGHSPVDSDFEIFFHPIRYVNSSGFLIRYKRSKVSLGVAGRLQWSCDLIHWHESGAVENGEMVVFEETVESSDIWTESVTVAATRDGDLSRSIFTRLIVRFVSDPAPQGFALIPAGSFTMGPPRDEWLTEYELTQHKVTLSRDFYMATTELTWGQWRKAMNRAADFGYKMGGVGNEGAEVNDLDPVSRVYWWQAALWCNLLSELNGLKPVYYNSSTDFSLGNVIREEYLDPVPDWSADGYRLPTEAEWEYACRAGTTTDYYTGDMRYREYAPVDPSLDAAGWYWGNTDTVQPVAQKEPNAWGLYDMHGNVEEYCWDYYRPVSDGSAAFDPIGTVEGPYVGIRGGSFGLLAEHCRSGYQRSARQLSYSEGLGFRIVRSSVSNQGFPPQANAGPNIEIVAPFGESFALVDLDGGNSSGGDADIVTWDWTWGDNGYASGRNARANFPLGETLVTMTVTDDDGRSSSEDLRIFVNSVAQMPAGTFTMGSPGNELGHQSNETLHEVTLTRNFSMSATEVTWRLWDQVGLAASNRGYWNLSGDTTGLWREYGFDLRPVTGVSWFEAVWWCNLRSEMEGLRPVYYTSPVFGAADVLRSGEVATYADWGADGYRLPTEAEWEYACRAGTTTAFYSGDISYLGSDPRDPNLESVGWYTDNAVLGSHLVGQKQANPWGLYDMHGNVFEWCWDWYGDYDGDTIDPKGPSSGEWRVFRGGSAGDRSENCRSAVRGSMLPSTSNYLYGGFRVVRTLSPSGGSPPRANAGPDIYAVASEGETRAIVSLDGSSTEVGDEGIESWNWSWGGGSARGETVQASFPLGKTLVTLTVEDRGGRFTSDSTYIVVNESAASDRFARIPAGTFTMGSPSGEPGHAAEEDQVVVTLSHDFFLSSTEVTWRLWHEVEERSEEYGYDDLAEGGLGGAGSDQQPVAMISWWDAIKWCNLRSELEGLKPVYYVSGDFQTSNVIRTSMHTPHVDWKAGGYRLPTEAEWEYACRAGTTTAFSAGNLERVGISPKVQNLEAVGWYVYDSSLPQPVGKKDANAWGLYDMHGNVFEWCWDLFGDYADVSVDPTGAISGTYRVGRGGSFASIPESCRSATRTRFNQSLKSNNIGFRLVRGSVP